jgi:hypothetical protein
MTSTDVEARLVQALSFEPSADALRWLDRHVGQIAARPAAASRRRVPARRVFLRPLLVIAAFVLLTGAAAAALGLLDRVIESSGQGGWHTAWKNAERLDLTATDAGVTITVERAYADLNQVLVGFTVAGLEAPTSSTGPAKLQWHVAIEDPTGRSAQQWAAFSMGMGMEETGLSAIVQTWEGPVSPAAGTWVLTFTAVGYHGGGFVSGECFAGSTLPECLNPRPNDMMEGLWRFEFELPRPAGAVVAPGASTSREQGTLSLSELRVSPTMISATLGLRVAEKTILDWGWTNGRVRHDGSAYALQASVHLTHDPSQQGPQGDLNRLMTVAGADMAAGTWEFEFGEITFRTSDGEEVLPGGPWTLTVTVP